MANTDEGGQKHTLPRDEETKAGMSTANTDQGGQSTHFLETRGQRGGGVSMVNTDQGG
jgi:hypothetical protein